MNFKSRFSPHRDGNQSNILDSRYVSFMSGVNIFNPLSQAHYVNSFISILPDAAYEKLKSPTSWQSTFCRMEIRTWLFQYTWNKILHEIVLDGRKHSKKLSAITSAFHLSKCRTRN